MWKYTFCGNFSILAFPNIVFNVITIIYILELIISETNFTGLNSFVFLGSDLYLLDQWGAKNPYEIRYNYQYWRLITPIFLTLGF